MAASPRADAPSAFRSDPVRSRLWPRLALVEALQLPAVGLVFYGQGPTAIWIACLIGSFICCAGTDSGWRWTNRLLVAQATVWLTVALTLGT